MMKNPEDFKSRLEARFAQIGLKPSEQDLERLGPVAQDLDATAERRRVIRPFSLVPTIGSFPLDAKKISNER